MSTEILAFSFDSHNVSVHFDAQGEPWWVLDECCNALSLSDVHKAAERIELEDRKKYPVLAADGKIRDMWVINESGLYTLILRSSKPDAKRFKRWITRDVLPSIRKTGSYSITPQPNALPADVLPAIQGMVQAMQLVVGVIPQIQTQLATQTTDIMKLEVRMEQVEAHQDNKPGYMTILGYGRLKKFRISLAEARQYGQQLRQKAKELGIKLGKVPDERWGTVNSYPVELLEELFAPLFETQQLLDGD